MRIIFVRHGITQANIEKKFSKPDTPLAKNGYEILDKTKELLKNYKIKKVFVSEYLRTKESAKYLGYKDYIIDSRINEIDVGDFKGLSYEFVLNNYKDKYKQIKNDFMNQRYPNGESRLDVIKRVSNFLEEIKNEDSDILCISHGIAIRSTLFWIIKDLNSYDNFWIDNGSLTVFNINDGKSIIECVNKI